jgi:aryl-alcohol dehydrogenase-like predicted oxidoreductase
VVLATKYWFSADWTPDRGTRELMESLDRLRTRTVDVLQYHGLSFNDETADRILGSGVLEWADEMRAAGRCRFLGITAEAPSGALERLLRTGKFSTLLCAYNLIYQSWCDYQREPTGIIPLARSFGMGIATMRPATSGFLQKLLPHEFPGLDPSRLAMMAIKFALSTPEVDCAVIGMRNPSEVTANIDLADNTSDRYDLKELHDRFD